MFPTGSQPDDPLAWRFYGAEAIWRLSNRIEGDLPALAADAISEGFDSLALALLAGEHRTAVQADLGDLLLRAARELGIPEPDEGGLAERVLRYRSWQIAEGELEPVEGALSIERLLYDESLPRAAADFSLDDDLSRGGASDDPTALEHRIRAAASAVLASPPGTL